MAAGNRPRSHCHRGKGHDKLKKEGVSKEDWKRRLLKGVLEVERGVRHPDRKAASQAGFFCRLGQRALYHGRRLLRRSFGSIYKTLREGYIYKGSRIINWCPVCQTSISDAEVVHEDQDGFSGTSIIPS